MNDGDTTLPQQIAFLESALISMHRDFLAATSEMRRAALVKLIKETRNRVKRLKRKVAGESIHRSTVNVSYH
jgi:hypothetical protein